MAILRLPNSVELTVKSVTVLSYSRKHCGMNRMSFETFDTDRQYDQTPDEFEALRQLYEHLTKKYDGFIYIPVPKFKAIVVYAENSEFPEQIIRPIGYKSEPRILTEGVSVCSI